MGTLLLKFQSSCWRTCSIEDNFVWIWKCLYHAPWKYMYQNLCNEIGCRFSFWILWSQMLFFVCFFINLTEQIHTLQISTFKLFHLLHYIWLDTDLEINCEMDSKHQKTKPCGFTKRSNIQNFLLNLLCNIDLLMSRSFFRLPPIWPRCLFPSVCVRLC